MEIKTIIVPKGERNSLEFFRKVRTIDAIVYFSSKLLKKNGIVVDNTTERLIVRIDNKELTFNNGYNVLHHQLLKIGDKSYAPIRHDERKKIIIFTSE